MFVFSLYRYATPHKISDLHLQVVWRNPTQCEVSHSNYGLQTFLGSSCSNPFNIDHVFCEIWTPLNISAFPQWFQTWHSEIPIVSSFLLKMWWLVRKHPYLNLCKNTVTTTGRGIWRTFSVASSCEMAKKNRTTFKIYRSYIHSQNVHMFRTKNDKNKKTCTFSTFLDIIPYLTSLKLYLETSQNLTNNHHWSPYPAAACQAHNHGQLGPDFWMCQSLSKQERYSKFIIRETSRVHFQSL